MAIAFVSTGASGSAAGGTSVTPGYPATISAGNLLVLHVAQHYPLTGSTGITTPAGWTTIQYVSDGNVQTFAADAGAARILIAVKEATGAETGTLPVTVDTTGSASTTTTSRINNFSKSGAMNWDYSASVVGTDSSIVADTSWSATSSSNLSLTAGDMVDYGIAHPTDLTGWAAGAITETGITFGTIVQDGRATSSAGFNVGMPYGHIPVSSGTANTTIAHTGTQPAGNWHGPEVFLRLREVTPSATTDTTKFFAFF